MWHLVLKIKKTQSYQQVQILFICILILARTVTVIRPLHAVIELLQNDECQPFGLTIVQTESTAKLNGIE